jgi:hypothetical protein
VDNEDMDELLLGGILLYACQSVDIIDLTHASSGRIDKMMAASG